MGGHCGECVLVVCLFLKQNNNNSNNEGMIHPPHPTNTTPFSLSVGSVEEWDQQ